MLHSKIFHQRIRTVTAKGFNWEYWVKKDQVVQFKRTVDGYEFQTQFIGGGNIVPSQVQQYLSLISV